MRIVVFGPGRRVGAWEGDRVIDLNRAFAAANPRAEADVRVPANLAQLIERGSAGLDDAQIALDYARAKGGDGIVYERAAVKLHAPTVYRPRIACAAGNFAVHTLGSSSGRASAGSAPESKALAGLVEPGQTLSADEILRKTRERGRPRGFWKDFAIEKGPDDEVAIPARCELFDYEGELAVVIGKRTKDVRADQGAEYIWGVTLLNDWSIRGADKSRESLSLNLSKNFEGSASIGPAILVGDLNIQEMDVEVRVNGQLRQRYNSRDMIFSFAEYLEYLTKDLALLPGDMISGGSGAGSAIDSSKMRRGGEKWPDDLERDLFLKPGDVVEVSSPAIGTLRNQVVAKT